MAAGKKKPEEKDGIHKDYARFTRAAAEKKIARSKKIPHELNVLTPEQLIHELRVHQIELETQAEELKTAQLSLENSRDKYLDLYDFAPVGYFTLTDKARITVANLTLATLLGVERRDLVTHGFGQFIAHGELERWDRFFAEVRQDVKKQSCTLTLKRGDGSTFPARLEGQRIAGSREKSPTVRVAVSDISDLWMAGEALRLSHDNLEIIVSERTARLADANRDLLEEIAERKKTDKTLQESRENLQAFFNATTDPLVLLAPDGTILAANVITAEAFGAPADTVIGKNAYQLLPPAIVKHRKKIVDRVVKTKKPAEYEDERAGRYLHHHVYPVMGDDGNVRSVAIYAKDITLKKTQEAALRESEEKYRTLSAMLRLMCDNVPDMIWAKDLEKRYLFANRAICRDLLNANDTDEPVGKQDMFFAERERTRHADDPEWHTFGEICRDTDQITMDAGTPRKFDEYGNVQGTFLFLDVFKAPFLDEHGNMIGTVGSARDVTLAKGLEAALKKSEEFNRNLVDNIPDYILIYDPQGTILYTNPIFAKIFGFTPEEAVGSPILEHIAPEYRDRIRILMEQRIYEITIPPYEISILKKDGSAVPVIVKGTHIRFQDNDSVLVLMTDISEHKRMVQAVYESEEKFRTLFESMAPGVFYQRSDGTLIDANPAALRMFGLTREQFTGRDSYDPRWKVVSETGELLSPEQHPSMIALRSGKPVKDLIVGVYNPARDEMTWLSTNAEPQFRNGEATPYQVFVTMYDITERRRAEEALKESEQLLSEVFDNANDAIYLLERTPDGPGKYLLVNDKAIRMLGYSKEEFMGMSPKDIVPEDMAKKIMPGVIKKLLKDGHATFESAHRRKDGSIYPVEVSTHTFCYRGKDVDLSIVRDNTERKQAEKDLQESHERFRATIASLDDAIFLVDPVTRLISECNDAATRVFGYLREELVGRQTGFLHVDQAHLEQFGREALATYDDKGYYMREFEMRRKDGCVFPTEHFVRPIKDPDGRILYVVSVVRDISGRKQAEVALKESEERIRQITDTITSVFYIHDRVSNLFIYVSPAYETIWKRSCQSLIDNPYSFIEAVHPDDLPRLQNSIRKELEEGIYVDTDYRIIHPDGSVHWIRSRNFPIVDKTGQTFRVAGIAEDITDLKGADLSLKAAKEYAETLIQTANAMVVGLDNHGTITLFNEAAETITGYTAAELAGRNWFEVIVPKEQYPQVWEEFNRLLTGGLPINFENPILTKSGEEHYIVWKNSEIRNNEQTVGTISFGIDITERKRAEVAIGESEARFHSMFERHDSVMLLIDPETGKIIDANLAAAEFYGRSQEELCSQSIDEINTLSKEEVAAERMKALREKKNFFVFPHRLASGEIRTVEVHSSPIEVGGKAVLFSVISDITERKRAEDALYESEKKYRSLVTTLNEGVWYVTPDLITSYLNPRMAGMLGYTVEEMNGRPLADFIEPVSMRVVEEQVERRKKGHTDQYEITLQKKDGRTIIVRATASPLLDEQGRFIGSVAGIEDITERKHYEDVLTLANRFFSISNHHQQIAPMLDEVVHTIQEYTGCDSVGIRLLDIEGNIPYTSYAGFADSFYGRESPLNIQRDECMCIYVIRGDTNPDLPVITAKGSFWCNGTTKFLVGVSDEDKGRTRNVCNEVGYESVALVAIKQGDTILGLIHIADHREGMVPLETVEVLEEISQALGSAIQRLLAETGIRNSLTEKEVLLREIHHRVKNNLSGIISLIELQISSLTDPVNISLLQDLETRVRSMALVHESLYLTKDLARISTATYTENLTRHMFQVYGKSPEIRYAIEMGEIMMPIETAVPFGLVISEIITNSLKYAFPPSFSCEELRREPCTISLTFHREGNGYLLTIADNGIGIPNGNGAEGSHTLGLFLINFIVKHQLRGSVEINNVGGTAYTIRFP